MSIDYIKQMTRLANDLDGRGFHKEADILDQVVEQISKYSYDLETESDTGEEFEEDMPEKYNPKKIVKFFSSSGQYRVGDLYELLFQDDEGVIYRLVVGKGGLSLTAQRIPEIGEYIFTDPAAVSEVVDLVLSSLESVFSSGTYEPADFGFLEKDVYNDFVSLLKQY